MSGMLSVTALTISSAVVVGLVLALFGRLKSLLAERGLGEDRRLWALNLALPFCVLLAGLLVDLQGPRLIIIAGSVAVALAVVALSRPPTYARAVVALFAAVLGAAGLGTASLVPMPRAFFGPDEITASLHVGTVFFALGALLAATLADVLFQVMGRGRALPLLAFLCLVPAFLAPLPPTEQLEPGHSSAGLMSVVSDLDLWLGGLVLFFYAPLEAAVCGWIAAHMTGEEEGKPRGRWILPGFWAVFFSSRLLFGLLNHAGYLSDGYAGWLLVVPAALAAVLVGNLAGMGGERSAGWVLVLGFLLGPIFSSLLGLVFLLPAVRHTHSQGFAFALVFASGSVGGAVLAPFVRSRIGGASAQAAMRLPLFLALLLGAAALVFGLMAN